MPHRAEACFLSPEDAARIYKKPATVTGLEMPAFGITEKHRIDGIGLSIPAAEIKRGDVIVGKPRRSTDG